MALTKNKKVNKIMIKGDFKIIIAEYLNQILDDGNLIAESYERQSFTPDTAVDDLPTEVQPYASTAWTSEIVSAYVNYVS